MWDSRRHSCNIEREYYYYHTRTQLLSYLDEVLGIGGKDRVEDEVVQVSMLGREMVIVVDKILNVVVRANILHILE